MDVKSVFQRMIRGEIELPKAAQTLGWRFVSFDEAAREMRVCFDASPALSNPLGAIQGGMLSAMLDDCMGPVVYLTMPADSIALTVEATTRYFSPAYPGAISAIGRVEQMRGRHYFTSGELLDAKGSILASASAVYYIKSSGSAVT